MMIRSEHRILTTHVGSLPRNETLAELLIANEAGDPIDLAALEDRIDQAVAHVVERQTAAGIDVGNDGEQGRVGFQTYVSQRMTGFAGESKRRRAREYEEFPAFTKMILRRFPRRAKVSNAPQAVKDVHYRDRTAILRELERFRGTAGSERFQEKFMTAPSPGIIATTLLNAHYDSHEAYVMALAREIRTEYRAIVDAGLLLQVDAPDLAMERTIFYQDLPDSEFLEAAELHVAALNEALRDIPLDRVRLHCCWGNWEGPHVHDVSLDLILPILYQANVGALSIEFANPRHQHEYVALRHNKFPDRLVLLPGVIDSTSNYVEHPEVIAERLERAVSVVGDRERVIASADCGFGTFAGYEFVAEDVVWAKLRSLRDGADIASQRIWGKDAA